VNSQKNIGNWSLYAVPKESPLDAVPASGAENAPPPGQWQKVRVASYRLGEANGGYRGQFWSEIKKFVDQKGKEAITVVVKTIWDKQETKTFLTPNELAYTAVAPFYGKGSPEEVQIMLQLRYRFQKVTLALNDFTKAAFIGLDCNGFVGNYVQRAVKGAHWYRRSASDPGPSTCLSSLMKLGTRIKSMDDLNSPSDTFLLAMTDASGNIIDHIKSTSAGGGTSVEHGHIMITQPSTVQKSGNELQVQVLESAGGVGLVESTYKILSVSAKGVFKIFRGSKSSNMNVVITKLQAG
jgi:hypothetical protein